MKYQLNPLLVIVPPQYVSALLKLHQKLEGKGINWVLSGNLSEELQGVKIDADCIEIVTSKDDAEKIQDSVKEFNPEPLSYQVQQIPQNAVVNDQEYPVFSRSHYFEFFIDGIKVKVNGDLQYKVGDWGWGDKFEFNPKSIYIVNKNTFIVPLYVNFELYQKLGWTDRLEKIISVIVNHQRMYKRF